MAANCCSGNPCEELVTLGYMIDMASSCGSVSAHSDFSSCCSADGSAYTPTYSDIINGRYANVRSIASNPKNDVNGFSAYTQELDTNECGGVTANDKLLAKNQLTFEYTELTSVTISSPSVSVDSCGYSYSTTKNYRYLRHKVVCGDDTTTNVTFNENASGSRGASSVSFHRNGDNGYFDVSYPNTSISASATDKCGNTKSDSKTISVSDSSYSCSITPPSGSIPCEGGTINFNADGEISYSFTLDGSDISSSSGQVTIPQNDANETSHTLIMNVYLCGESGSLSITFEQDLCKHGPDAPTSTSPCGVYWPEKKPEWENEIDAPTDNYGCNLNE